MTYRPEDKAKGRRHFWYNIAGVLLPTLLFAPFMYYNWILYKMAFQAYCG